MKHLLTDANLFMNFYHDGYDPAQEGEDIKQFINSRSGQSATEIAEAQYDLLLSKFPKSEDLGKWAVDYHEGYLTMVEFKELIKKEIFGDENNAQK